MRLTAEQELIVARARDSTDNFLISARAGAAKTTSIQLIAEALPDTRILALSFNKKIADELKARLPANCESSTLNGLCHRAFGRFLGRHLKVDTRKVSNLIKEAFEFYGSTQQERAALQESWADIRDAVSAAKLHGFLPARHNALAKPLISEWSDLTECLDTKFSELEKDVILRVVVKNFDLAMKGEIDFDDQIYMAAIMGVSFESFPLTIVDEAQDLSIINHHLLGKIVRTRRLIAVGDPFQAIYGFRGADEESMDRLRERFSMSDLALTMCFRSAQSVVREARWRASDMVWRPGADEGRVWPMRSWGPAALREGDVIVCRNNAPLFRMALELLRVKLHPQLASGDVIRGLLAMMDKLGKARTPTTEALAKLGMLADAAKARKKDARKVEDQIECLRIFLEETETVGEAKAYLEDVAKRSGKITLMTVHKAKGLEFDRVFILDRKLIRLGNGQEDNLLYVAQTRAKHELYYVETDHWNPEWSAADAA